MHVILQWCLLFKTFHCKVWNFITSTIKGRFHRWVQYHKFSTRTYFLFLYAFFNVLFINKYPKFKKSPLMIFKYESKTITIIFLWTGIFVFHLMTMTKVTWTWFWRGTCEELWRENTKNEHDLNRLMKDFKPEVT